VYNYGSLITAQDALTSPIMTNFILMLKQSN